MLSDERLREIAAYQPIEFRISGSELISMARELLSRRASPHGEAGVTVKPLEWQELTEDRGDGTREPNGDWEAPAPFGFYEIEMVTGHDGTVVWGVTFGVEEEYIGGDHASPDAAKAAAQADYEARIRSALLPSPSVETVWVQQRSLDEVREQGRSEETFLWAEGRADDHVPLYLSAPGSSAGAGDGIPLKLRRYDAMLRAECAYKGPCADKLACDCSSNALHDRHMAALAPAPPQREGLEEASEDAVRKMRSEWPDRQGDPT